MSASATVADQKDVPYGSALGFGEARATERRQRQQTGRVSRQSGPRGCTSARLYGVETGEMSYLTRQPTRQPTRKPTRSSKFGSKFAMKFQVRGAPGGAPPPDHSRVQLGAKPVAPASPKPRADRSRRDIRFGNGCRSKRRSLWIRAGLRRSPRY